MIDRLHITVGGEGPPLVLIHGWAMHGGVFATLIDRLRDRVGADGNRQATTLWTQREAQAPSEVVAGESARQAASRR